MDGAAAVSVASLSIVADRRVPVKRAVGAVNASAKTAEEVARTNAQAAEETRILNFSIFSQKALAGLEDFDLQINSQPAAERPTW